MGLKVGEGRSLYTRLLEEAAFISGFDGGQEEGGVEAIPWLDPSLLAKGRQWVEDNLTAVFAHLLAANWIGFLAKQVSAVFFHNFISLKGQGSVCGQRFIRTFATELTWLNSCETFGDPSAPFMTEVKRVRRLHGLYCRRKVNLPPPPQKGYPPEYGVLLGSLRKDLDDLGVGGLSDDLAKIVTWDPEMVFTQLDLAIVLYGGIVQFVTDPQLFGIKGGIEDNEGLRGYFHIWAVVGRLLGLRDEYNPALHPSREGYLEIRDRIGFPSLKDADERVLFTLEALLQDFNSVLPFQLTTKGLLYAFLTTQGQAAPSLWTTMSLRDKATFASLKLFKATLSFSFTRKTVNFILKRALKQYLNL